MAETAIEPDNKLLIEALKLESTELNGRIQEIYKAVYTLFGAVLPAVLTVFALLAKHADEVERPYVAFIFVVVVSLASIWSSSLWMEALVYLRYRYVEFQPRLYAATGQQGKHDVVSFSATGQPLRWFPSTVLNWMLFLVVFGVWWQFIPIHEGALKWTAFLFPVAAVACFVAVHAARMQYMAQVEKARSARAKL